MTDLDAELDHHARNHAVVICGIAADKRESLKERAKRMEHRCRGFLECLEGLRLELEKRGEHEHPRPNQAE